MTDKYAELRIAEPAPNFDDWPEYHDSGMGCGLEDRGITDRYEAMRHGWECALERVAERLPEYDASRVVVSQTGLAELLDERDALAAEVAELRGALPLLSGRPAEPGVYINTCSGFYTAVYVHKRPTDHVPGMALKGSVLDPSKFFDGCAIDSWVGNWYGPVPRHDQQTAPSGQEEGDV